MKYVVTLNGKNYEVEVTETDAVLLNVSEASAPVVAPVAAPVAAPAPAATAAAPAVAGEGTKVPSPMPGTILSINVAVGQAVKSGDVLLVLEAMKMENDIVAPCDGTVKQLLVSKGSTVNTDDVLVVI
ncbi:MAG: biotin/lipoyl-binding protein [Ruminococcaceae bacterium]|nr:biotin/lipoyl-binding protein [Oscillospiraceae bacterium]